MPLKKKSGLAACRPFFKCALIIFMEADIYFCGYYVGGNIKIALVVTAVFPSLSFLDSGFTSRREDNLWSFFCGAGGGARNASSALYISA